MKFKIFGALIILSVTQSALANTEAITCEAAKTFAETKKTAVKVHFQGSDNFMTCDKLSLGKMQTIYGKNGVRSDSFDWDPYIKHNCCEKNKDSKETKKDEIANCVKETSEFARTCESVALMISIYDRDWNDEEINSPSSKETTGKIAAAPGTNPAQALAMAGSVKCKSEGMETLDYDACVKFTKDLEMIEAFQTVGYQTQEVVYKDKMSDAQVKYANEQNSATGALKGTADSLRMQQDMYNQRTAIDTVKLGYMYNTYKNMPTANEIKGKCSQMRTSKTIGGVAMSPEICATAVSGRSGYSLMMNQNVRDTMKAKLIGIATAAGSSLILASLLGKRADDVDGAIAKIDAFKPIDPFVVSEEEAQTTYCKMNPGQPQCLPSDLTRTFDTVDGNVITFGGAGTGTTYAPGNSIQDTQAIGSDGAIGGSSVVTPVGSIIASANKDNTIEASTGASVTSKPNSSSGSGGGGGGSGGALGGGGGGGSGGGAAGEAASSGNVTKAPGYTGGAGSFSVVGGFGINKKKAEGGAEENPFGKLFGKDAPNKNGVVNFRDIASQKVGDKSQNIFDMISKRYTNVAADKRLIEYELTK
ncbi:MAG: hypothetical protein HOP07_02890 [Bacteriovoracaceae bacterium]|nr:hypothetical protein [Bacteriovoracaceae bacterium]